MATNAKEIPISINGAEGKFTSPLPVVVEEALSSALCYRDRSKEYIKKKMNWESGPTLIQLYKAKTRTFPTGLLGLVKQVLRPFGYTLKVTQERPFAVPVAPVFPEYAYEHQIEIVQRFLTVKRGIAELPPGKGKTLAACMIISCFPESVVIVAVPTVDLARQVRTVVQDYIGEPVGLIGAGGKRWERVTVGVAKSLGIKATEGHPKIQEAELLIFDEHHRTPASYYQEISRGATSAMWRLGLTATAFRAGGDGILMAAAAGLLFYKMKPGDKNFVPKSLDFRYYQVTFHHEPRTYPKLIRVAGEAEPSYDTWNHKPDPKDVYEAGIVWNRERNELICELTVAYVQNPKRIGAVVVLAERIAHCEDLARRLSGILQREVPLLTGSTDNKKALQNLKDNAIDVCVGSRILDEGIDLPFLELVVIAGGGKDRRRLIQQVGRCQRTPPGKTRGWILDIADDEAFYLADHARIRLGVIAARHPNKTRIVNKYEAIREMCS
jgi:superfamily II DNA or RNA helicase